MTKKIFKGITLFALLFTIFSATLTGAYSLLLPDSISCMSPDAAPSLPFAKAWTENGSLSLSAADKQAIKNYDVDYKLYGFIPLKKVRVNNYEELKLYPGGMPFGIKFITDGILVVGFADVKSGGKTVNPSSDAGIKLNDMILRIDGKEVGDAGDLTKIVEESNGKSLKITYSRDGKEHTTTLKPAYSDSEGKYKTGIYVKDSGAGIGTVTYIVPSSNSFAGLGHGICDSDTGKLIPMQRGSVVDVTINGVVKGIAGTPGEVKGYFSSGKTGSLLGNTHQGVFGVFADLPKTVHADPLPIGLRNEVKDGKAYIYCTLDNNTIGKYEIEISNILTSSTSNKCFTIKVTDPALIEKTGGIVQGMSGSPIIQNGKIIGAVTHVLINDPTSGYGIFIENMLDNMADVF